MTSRAALPLPFLFGAACTAVLLAACASGPANLAPAPEANATPPATSPPPLQGAPPVKSVPSLSGPVAQLRAEGKQARPPKEQPAPARGADPIVSGTPSPPSKVPTPSQPKADSATEKATDERVAAHVPKPLEPPPSVPSCDGLSSAALDEYDAARRQNRSPNADVLFGKAAGTLAEAAAACAGKRPEHWGRLVLALANASYYSRQYEQAAVWFRKIAEDKNRTTDDARPGLMAAMLSECRYDKDALDLARQGSVILIGHEDEASRLMAAERFLWSQKIAKCDRLRDMAARSAAALLKQKRI